MQQLPTRSWSLEVVLALALMVMLWLLLLGQRVTWQRGCLHIFCDCWRPEPVVQHCSVVPQHVANDNACSEASKGCRCVHTHTKLQMEVAGVLG